MAASRLQTSCLQGKLPVCASPGLCTAGKSRTLPGASPELLAYKEAKRKAIFRCSVKKGNKKAPRLRKGERQIYLRGATLINRPKRPISLTGTEILYRFCRQSIDTPSSSNGAHSVGGYWGTVWTTVNRSPPRLPSPFTTCARTGFSAAPALWASALLATLLVHGLYFLKNILLSFYRTFFFLSITFFLICVHSVIMSP